MLLQIYITITIIAFIFFILGVFLGSFFKNQNKIDPEQTPKKGISTTFLFTSMVLFIFLALNSLNIEQEYCENQQTTTISTTDTSTVNITTTNTTITNTINCLKQQYVDDAIAYFYWFMSFISLFFVFVVIL